MSDGVAITAGSGTTVLTDEVTTVNGSTIAAQHAQRIKVVTGVDGVATDVSAANPFPVSDAGGLLSVDDGGGSLTVDGTVGVSGTVTVSGTVSANPDTVATASVPAQVAGSATSVQLLASNSSRKGAIVVNDSTAILYVKYGTTASTTSYTYKLAAGDTLEIPTRPVYTGRIDGIWASATGAAAVTEL